MNTLIAMGTLSAYLYSSAVTFFPDFFRFLGEEPKIYFDTSVISAYYDDRQPERMKLTQNLLDYNSIEIMTPAEFS